MTKFGNQLLDELWQYRSKMQGDITRRAPDDNSIMPREAIAHWLKFAIYYERAASVFIGQWLKTTPEDDAFHYFTRQIEDEATHYHLLRKYQRREFGDQNFQPPEQWVDLMDNYYANLPTLIERLAAHNLAAETGALGFLEYAHDRFPEEIRGMITRIAKDERFHVNFGVKLLNKYCVTPEQQALARASAFEAMEKMDKARAVFVGQHEEVLADA